MPSIDNHGCYATSHLYVGILARLVNVGDTPIIGTSGNNNPGRGVKRLLFPANNQCISIITLDGMLSLFREEEQLGADACLNCVRPLCFQASIGVGNSSPANPSLLDWSARVSIRHQQLGFTSNALLSSTGVA